MQLGNPKGVTTYQTPWKMMVLGLVQMCFSWAHDVTTKIWKAVLMQLGNPQRCHHLPNPMKNDGFGLEASLGMLGTCCNTPIPKYGKVLCDKTWQSHDLMVPPLFKPHGTLLFRLDVDAVCFIVSSNVWHQFTKIEESCSWSLALS